MNSSKRVPGQTGGTTATAQRSILLVSTRSADMAAFAEALGSHSRMPVETAASAEQALEAVRQGKAEMVVVDERLGETAGLDLIRRLLEVDAFIHTAVLSAAGEEDFHERSEGLGVLAKLPLVPGPDDARRLIELLNNITPH